MAWPYLADIYLLTSFSHSHETLNRFLLAKHHKHPKYYYPGKVFEAAYI